MYIIIMDTDGGSSIDNLVYTVPLNSQPQNWLCSIHIHFHTHTHAYKHIPPPPHTHTQHTPIPTPFILQKAYPRV